MTDIQFSKVQRGAIVRNYSSSRSYVVVDVRYDDVDKRYTLILADVIEADNPPEWHLVKP